MMQAHHVGDLAKEARRVAEPRSRELRLERWTQRALAGRGPVRTSSSPETAMTRG